MRNIIYLLISIVISITMISAVQINTDQGKTLTLQSENRNAGASMLRQSSDIISARLKFYGIKSFQVKVAESKAQIQILLHDTSNISAIKSLVTSAGQIAFYETYTHDEVAGLFKSDNPLYSLLNHDMEKDSYDPRLGCTENIKKADDALSTAGPVKNCKLLWHDSKNSGHCLFALKTGDNGNPLLVKSDIESVKMIPSNDGPKIHITLKPGAVNIFAAATKNNMYKSMAIVIDNKVYSWPVIKSVISGGEIEVTGSFTPQEVNYFPALFNSDQLPLSFKLL